MLNLCRLVRVEGPRLQVWKWEVVETKAGGRAGREWLKLGNQAYVHGNVPGHVDVGFVFIHPDLGGSQGISLGVVVDVVVVGLLGALDVSHSGAREDLHAAATLPHLHSEEKTKI